MKQCKLCTSQDTENAPDIYVICEHFKSPPCYEDAIHMPKPAQISKAPENVQKNANELYRSELIDIIVRDGVAPHRWAPCIVNKGFEPESDINPEKDGLPSYEAALSILNAQNYIDQCL